MLASTDYSPVFSFMQMLWLITHKGLRWTPPDRGRGPAPCGCPHKKFGRNEKVKIFNNKLVIQTTNSANLNQLQWFYRRISVPGLKWKVFALPVSRVIIIIFVYWRNPMSDQDAVDGCCPCNGSFNLYALSRRRA